MHERFFPCIKFDDLNTFDNVIQYANPSVCLSHHVIAVFGRHFAHHYFDKTVFFNLNILNEENNFGFSKLKKIQLTLNWNKACDEYDAYPTIVSNFLVKKVTEHENFQRPFPQMMKQ